MIHLAATTSIDHLFGDIYGYGPWGSCLSCCANAEVLPQGGGGLLALKFSKFKKRFSPYMKRVPQKGSDKDSVKLALVNNDDEEFPKEGLTLLVSKAYGLHTEEHNLNLEQAALYAHNPPRAKVKIIVENQLNQDIIFETSTQYQALHKVKPEWDEYIHFTPGELQWPKRPKKDEDQSSVEPLKLTLEVITENFLDAPEKIARIELLFTEEELSDCSWNRHCRLLETKQTDSVVCDIEDNETDRIKNIKPSLEFQVMIRRPGKDPPKVCVHAVIVSEWLRGYIGFISNQTHQNTKFQHTSCYRFFIPQKQAF